MPVYEYACAQCGAFTATATMSARNDPRYCPACNAPASRVILTAPAFAGMPAASRAAHAVNELAANEPKSSADPGKSGACCGGSGTARSADGHKSFPARRPWMISH